MHSACQTDHLTDVNEPHTNTSRQVQRDLSEMELNKAAAASHNGHLLPAEITDTIKTAEHRLVTARARADTEHVARRRRLDQRLSKALLYPNTPFGSVTSM